MALRPFEVVLLEAVPHGEPPALPREFRSTTVAGSLRRAQPPIAVAVTEPPAATPSPAQQPGRRSRSSGPHPRAARH